LGGGIIPFSPKLSHLSGCMMTNFRLKEEGLAIFSCIQIGSRKMQILETKNVAQIKWLDDYGIDRVLFTTVIMADIL